MGGFSELVSLLGCGCCCAAVTFVIGVAVAIGFRGKSGPMRPLPGEPAAPSQGSVTRARLTHMDAPDDTEIDETVQLRPGQRPRPPGGS